MRAGAAAGQGPHVFLVAGEASGDALGASLMRALDALTEGTVRFSGVGGPEMTAAGLQSLFPIADIAVMGIGPVLARLPAILKRLRQTVEAAIATAPDVIVLIDAPDFCHRVGRRVRKERPDLPIVGYVSPTVWAWRPGRARKLAAVVDRLLAILPFEPEVHRRLAGPPTIYVGHPVLGRLDGLRAPGPREAPPGAPRRVLVLPGSRRSEIGRLMPLFGTTLATLAARVGPLEVELPAVDHLRAEIEAMARLWPVRPRIVSGVAAKEAAFRNAEVALAASGTVTLELAMAGVPMVVAYRLDWLGRRAKRLIKPPKPVADLIPVRTVVLPNLVIGEAAVPEFIDEAATHQALADALADLLTSGPARDAQLSAFARVEAAMRLPGGAMPGDAAAAAVMGLLRAR